MPPFSDALLIKRLCVADKRTGPAYTECVSRVRACVYMCVFFLRDTNAAEAARGGGKFSSTVTRDASVHTEAPRLQSHTQGAS